MPLHRQSNVPSIVPLPTTKGDEIKHRNLGEIGNNIRVLRTACGLTQPQLANILGITSNAVTNWESGATRPSITTIIKLCNVLGCSANELLGMPENREQLNEDESQIIGMYRTIHPSERRTIRVLMESMLDYQDGVSREEYKRNFVQLPYIENSFSAGTGNPLDDRDRIEEYMYLRATRDSCRADAVITVSGDSMTPTFQNGDQLLVQRTQTIEPGEIGLFVIGGEGFVKEYQPDGLHSHNKKYKTIHPTEDENCRCIGKVLGTVTDDMKPTHHEQRILNEIYREA